MSGMDTRATSAPAAGWLGDLERALPEDGLSATLVARIWDPAVEGPSVVAVRPDGLFDVTSAFPTVRDLCEEADPAAALAGTPGSRVGDAADVLANTPREDRDPARPWFLAPVDLQAVKAAGVTFAVSMLERVLEERARGDLDRAAALRSEILAEIGTDLRSLRPGSPEASRLKELLVAQGAWSQYLEVGIGPDAEIFTKCPPLAAVGTGEQAGVLASSTWNNPEPEVVLLVSSTGAIVGASLGNDVNLRDVEGRSALLLPKAKDNNASCALGPFLRLFDAGFDLDDVRSTSVTLTIEGTDGFRLEAVSELSQISRDPVDLVGQLLGPQHQYPDGAALFLGTMFAPVVDREAEGKGFTHHAGDVVTISAPLLGSLVNCIQTSESCAPWTFGTRALMRNLARRGLS